MKEHPANSSNSGRGPSGDADVERLARLYADDFEETEGDAEEGVSLEELSQSFARLVGAGAASGSPAADATEPPLPAAAMDDTGDLDSLDAPDHCPITPRSIVEAVLLVGRPDNAPITASELAALMRGVTQAEVDQLVDELNAHYLADHSALRIVAEGGGFRMQLADDLEYLRERFLGPARTVKLNQAAIDCLALVSYQPGISRELLEQQLGKPCGAVVNQLVRRQLLEMRRQRVEKKWMAHYYPASRLLELAGLESLDDLPTAEEWVDAE